jgi:hypothetical protein
MAVWKSFSNIKSGAHERRIRILLVTPLFELRQARASLPRARPCDCDELRIIDFRQLRFARECLWFIDKSEIQARIETDSEIVDVIRHEISNFFEMVERDASGMLLQNSYFLAIAILVCRLRWATVLLSPYNAQGPSGTS